MLSKLKKSEADLINWRAFIVSITIIVLLFCIGLFLGFYFRNKQLIEGQLLMRARAHFDSVILTRSWNASHGGVFVEKRPGVESNPYLESPDITTVDGKVYTMKNPALMTREISEIANERGDFKFHITSLKPLNPDNAPEAEEVKALELFERGETEHIWRERSDGNTYYRYMGPLMVAESCLECHAEQDYLVDDVRGGISIKFDVTEIVQATNHDFRVLLALGLLTAVMLLGSIYYAIYRLINTVHKAHEEISEMAVTDGLTGLTNRRHFFEELEREHVRSRRYEQPLGCMMLDLDHFKAVNDTYGHAAGDEVLKGVAKVIGNTFRTNDVPARYGGEEFICLMPHTDMAGCRLLAERLRAAIENFRCSLEDGTILTVTASIGVAVLSEKLQGEQFSGEWLIKCADEALYAAKRNGRNRVELYIG
jgi:diguanylate cyclase (GGDEF)-like protein